VRKTALAVIAITASAGGILTSASAQTPRATSAGARQAVAGNHDFDARNARRVSVRPDSEQAAAIRDMQDSNVQWDPSQGAPASVIRTRGYLTSASGAAPDQIARTYLKGHKRLFKLSDAEVGSLTRESQYKTAHNGVTQLALGQQDAGREVFDSVAAFVIDKSGRLVAQSGVLDPDAHADAPATLAAGAAVRAAADAVGAKPSGPLTLRSAGSGANRLTTFNDPYAPSLAAPRAIRAELVTFPMPAGQAARVAWKVSMEVNDSQDYESVVDARSGDVLLRRNSYLDAAPEGNVFTTQNPVPATGQPGLTSFSGVNGTWVAANTTQGNNANVYEDRDANDASDYQQITPAGPNFQRFLAPFTDAFANGPNAGTTAGLDADRDFVAAQLFYWINFTHDYFYGLGFNEAARNFQTNNFGNGGTGNDPVLGEVYNGWGDATGTQKLCQDSAMVAILCRDNASFNTQPEGTASRLTVLVNVTPNPRLNELEGDTIVHEYGHGLSNRLVGNGTLGGGTQTGAMGEGWGDFMATSIFNDPVIFEYTGSKTTTSGFRRVRYDTSPVKYSNLCFKDLGKTVAGCEVHNDGEIWATALWAMRTKLITKLGFASGKNQAEQLVVDGMKGLASNPTFLTGRNALLAADQTNNGGANKCLIWSVFAEHEMGNTATVGTAQGLGTTATDVPAECNVTASAGGSYTTQEGTNVTLSAAASTPGSAAGPLTYAWDFNNDGVFDDATGVSPPFTNVGDNGVFPVKVKVTGNNGDGFSAISAATNVTVTNVNPTVNTINGGAPQPEGTPVTVSGTITDPGWLDSLTATINWGDGSPTVALSGSTENDKPDATFTYPNVSHAYGDNGVKKITVCGTDDDGGSNCNTRDVTILNVPPTAGPITTTGPKLENTAIKISGTITDPGWLDTLTTTVDWGDGAGPQTLTGSTEHDPPDLTFTYTNVSHTYGDDGTFTITVCGEDDDGGGGCSLTMVTITNVNPTATIDETGTTNVNGTPVFFAHAGQTVAFKGNSTDPGSDDLTLRWNWDDGAPAIDASTLFLNNSAINPDPDPSPTINPRNVNDSKPHAFGQACFYNVGFSALDDDAGSAADSVAVIITGSAANHDKSAGFWAHEYQSASGDEISPVSLACYLKIAGFLSRVFDEVRNASTFAAARSVLNDGPDSARDRFDRVALTNWLNFANGAFEFNELMDTNGNGTPDTTFGNAMKNAETVRLNPAATTSQIDAQRKILQSFDS
jgi:hypothetical protein